MSIPSALVSEEQTTNRLARIDLLPCGDGIGERTKISEEHLSPSQIKMLLRCPAQYMFSYLDKRPRAGSHKLVRGSAVHVGAETYLVRKKDAVFGWDDRDHATAIEEAVDRTRDYVEQNYNESLKPIVISAKAEKKATKTSPLVPAVPERPMNKGELVDSAVAGTRFMAEASWRKIVPAAVEQGYMIRWSDGTLPILCYADAIELADDVEGGVVVGTRGIVHDLKTGASKSQIECDRDIALTAYCYAHELSTGISTRDATYQTLVYNQELKFDEKRTKRDSVSFRRLHTVAALAQRVMKSGLFPPCDDGQTCSWCDFSSICLSEF
jgi:CRISPR/Cas system-associated exonuclease Cas4 (RecB family)